MSRYLAVNLFSDNIGSVRKINIASVRVGTDDYAPGISLANNGCWYCGGKTPTGCPRLGSHRCKWVAGPH